MSYGPTHFVRVGLLGHVGRFVSQDATRFPRGSRVVCRTRRGLELGQVLGESAPSEHGDGALLRGATVEDELLAARLERFRDQAFQACSRLLKEHDPEAVLMDVEHLFDGQSIYFYFLGTPSPELEALTHRLGELYSTEVQFARFHETVTAGCGPDCGTEKAGGACGTSGCGSCAVAAACGK